ncbi:MAG: 2-succinyl-5-enolpyruvyl-6-hydroxy-3-cyclohexene-1-carboxylic-acid synthase [Cyanobacteria bacterium P01_D01_bin.73]
MSMPISFVNTNSIWAGVFVETLVRLGLRMAIACPGFRSTPLTVAVAGHPELEAIPMLDERSAAFFALGVARQTHRPVMLICSSGTAGANFFPAVIEARESGVPLIVLTADRPPELQNCGAGQAIDQAKLYGDFAVWYQGLAVPEADLNQLAYLRQSIAQGYRRAIATPGPVHFNQPFRDPLPPIPDPPNGSKCDRLSKILANPAPFFAHLAPPPPPVPSVQIPEAWRSPIPRGVIVAGPAQPQNPEKYCQAVTTLSQKLGWPVLAEGLSPIRNYAHLNPNLITTYDPILRNRDRAIALQADAVLQIGPLPTSKILRQWLLYTQARRWFLDGSSERGDRNLDPAHGPSQPIMGTVEVLAQFMEDWEDASSTDYCQQWLALEGKTVGAIADLLRDEQLLIESKISWLLPQILPKNVNLFINNSMPVRDIEWFLPPNQSQLKPFFNRGANGIEGTLSTAMGIAHANPEQLTVMLTGDLALLYDTNGFLGRSHFKGNLTIILVNNNGGGIFEMLPISEFNPPFEEFFATPQNIDFAKLSQTYDISYQRIENWEELKDAIAIKSPGNIRLLEIPTHRKKDIAWRKETFEKLKI